MEVRTIVTTSPEELSAAIKELLTHFDLYEIQNNTVAVGGKVQFIAYVYGREK